MIDILKYQGTTCVVTGAASGMGGACARILVELGADVIGLDVQDIEAPVKEAIRLDLMQEESIEQVVSQLPAKIDRLFNCAGIPGAPLPQPQGEAASEQCRERRRLHPAAGPEGDCRR